MAKLITKTYRMPEDLTAWIESNPDKSANQTIVDLLSSYKRVLQTSTAELKEKFTKDEWVLLADILNGAIITSTFRCNKAALCAEIEDAVNDGANHKYSKVKIDALKNKIEALTGAQLDALYTRVEEFWNNPDQPLEEWSTF